MNSVICFGQQPCGFFPKRFLIAKIATARRLQKELGDPDASPLAKATGDRPVGGAKIVFFYHDSDADYRETITIFRDRQTGAEVRLNFTQENKLQKKFSPLYLKRVPAGWPEEIKKQLPRFMDKQTINLFMSTKEKTVADFCLEMYRKLGLLDRISVIRSSDKQFREQALDLAQGFADVPYQGEIVRAHLLPSPAGGEEAGGGRSFAINTPSLILPHQGGGNDFVLSLHEGGERYIFLPKPAKIEKSQISAAANERMGWMQSVIHCTHYIYGEGEADYLKFDDFPDVKFIQRDKIDQPEYAWLG